MKDSAPGCIRPLAENNRKEGKRQRKKGKREKEKRQKGKGKNDEIAASLRSSQ
jgi:hypothetical protein